MFTRVPWVRPTAQLGFSQSFLVGTCQSSRRLVTDGGSLMEVDGCRPRAMDGWVFDGLWSCGILGHLVASVASSMRSG